MAEAQRLEQVDLRAAGETWRQCLPLLDPASPQYRAIEERIALLTAPLGPYQEPHEGWEGAPGPVETEPWTRAVGKTVFSMAISIAIYSYLWGYSFATGFVLLMLVHEMGHVLAVWRYGLSASPPIFIPFLGALINLRQPPPDAKVEAVVGIGGPLLGTVGAAICFAIYLHGHDPLFARLALFGMILNLFNLLPVPPLDGGRVMAAVSPWVWLLGLAGMAGLIGWEYSLNHKPSWILIIVLGFALPRVWRTLGTGARRGPYYQVPRAWSWGIAAVYLALAATLIGMGMHLMEYVPIA